MAATTIKTDPRHLYRKLNILVKVGIILMESAADSNRIIRNMRRVAAFLGLDNDNLHIDILYGTVKVSYCDETHSFSRFVHSDKYTINMKVLADVSQLSWKAIREDESIKSFERKLSDPTLTQPDYPAWGVTLGAALGSGGFAVLFGGDWPSFIPAAISGFVGFTVRHFMLTNRFNFYMVTALTAFIATLTAWLMFLLLPEGFTKCPYHPFLCSALFLVPGVALLVGLARLGNAALQIASMTFGIVLAVSVCGVTNFLGNLSMQPIISYWEAAIVTGISAMGFGMIFNVPRRSLPIVALLGVLGMCLRNFIAFDLHQGLILGSLAGATLISLLAVRFVHATRSPNHVLTIPGVIPMVPGILMYRGIFGFVHLGTDATEFMSAFGNLLNAGLIVLCLSIGVATPNIFVRRWIAKRRREELNALIAERRKRGKFVDLADFA